MNFKQSNYLMDVIMPSVKPTSFKIVAAIARQTWGWGELEKEISLTDFSNLTGIKSITTIREAIADSLEYINQTPLPNKQGFLYSMKPMQEGETLPENDIVQGQETSSTISNSDTVLCQNLTGTISNSDTVLYQKMVGTISENDTVYSSPKELIKELVKEPRERKGKEAPPPLEPSKQALADMVNALAEVAVMDGHANWTILSKTARDLIGCYTPDQIKLYYGRNQYQDGRWNWYLHDWRGKRNEPPAPKDIAETIKKAVTGMLSATPTANGTNGRKQTGTEIDIGKLLLELGIND